MAKTSTDTTHTPQYQKFAYDIAQHVYQKNLMEKNNILLSGLLFEYQHLDTLALGQNRIRVINNRYYDKYNNGVWQNPYKTKRTMAVATSTNQSSSSILKFMLPSNLFLSNISGQIATIEMNFDNGQGWQTITLDQYITVSFTQNRIHEFTTRINLSNGQQMLSRTKFKIDDPNRLIGPVKNKSASSSQKVRIDEGLPFTSSYIGADLTIRRMTSGQITKPLIIVEGFDSGHITDPADEEGDTSLRSFDRSIIESFAGQQLNDLLTGNTQQYDIIYLDWIKGTASMEDNSRILKQVIEWVNNEKTGTQPNVILGQSMGGVISRYTLAKWEQEDPNFNPANPENTSPHDVRLFIAHDSPMQGANTPLSIQHFTRHVKLQYVQTPLALATGEVLLPIAFNLAESVSDFINLFGANTSVDPYVSPLALLGIQDTPAARELNYWSLETWNHTQTQDYYDDWQSELNSVGYPLASRNVAISNGNECAEDHGFNPGDLLFKIDDVDNPDFFGDLLNMIGVPLLNVTRPLDFGLAIVGALPGASKWQYNFDFYATPTLGSQDRLYRGRIRYEKRVLWIGPRIKYDLTNRTFNSPASALPYDSYAGGYFDVNPYKCFNVNGQIECDFDFAIDLPSQVPPIQIEHRQYGFIPTLSALDIVKTNGNNPDPIDYLKTTSGGMIQDANLVSNFDNFIVDFQPNTRNNAPGNNPNNTFNSNNGHLSFQVRNGNWLAEEMEAQSPADYPVVEDCGYICNTPRLAIFGSESICGISEDFSVNVPNNATVTWSTDTTEAISISSSGSFASVSRVDNYKGSIKLIATVVLNGDCGPTEELVYEKNIILGKPEMYPQGLSSPGFPTNPFSFCQTYEWKESNWIYLFAFGAQPTSTYQFEQLTYNFQYSLQGNILKLIPSNTGTLSFKVRTQNDCGWSDWKTHTYQVTSCTGGGGLFYVAYPNPTSSSISVNVNTTSKKSSTYNSTKKYKRKDEHLDIEIYDNSGHLQKKLKKKLGEPIDITKLKNGVYVLRIISKDKDETHQVVLN